MVWKLNEQKTGKNDIQVDQEIDFQTEPKISTPKRQLEFILGLINKESALQRQRLVPSDESKLAWKAYSLHVADLLKTSLKHSRSTTVRQKFRGEFSAWICQSGSISDPKMAGQFWKLEFKAAFTSSEQNDNEDKKKTYLDKKRTTRRMNRGCATSLGKGSEKTAKVKKGRLWKTSGRSSPSNLKSKWMSISKKLFEAIYLI